MNPVNDRINSLATKIAGLDVSKLNALNGGGGGSASAAASATGNVPAATASQKGFSAAIIQTNNDLLEQKKKLVEIEEQMSEQVAIIEEVENKYNSTGDALRKLMPDIAMYTDKMNELVHIDQKLLDAYNGKIHLSKQEIDELIKKGTAIRQ